MSTRARLLAMAMIIAGAAGLVCSLFLTWSHQLTPLETATFHGAVLFGVAGAPDAWQVYAITGEVLAVLALGVVAAGLWGQRPALGTALLAVLVAVAFVVHARSVPPTNGLLLSTGSGDAARYVRDLATAGNGETIALISLIVQATGLALRFLLPEPTT